MTLEMKKFLETEDEKLQAYLKLTNSRIAWLDSEVEEISAEAKRLAHFYTRNMPVLTEEQKREIYLKIEQLFDEMARIDEEKVSLADMMYDTTTAHINRMDEYLHDLKKLREQRKTPESAEAASSPANNGGTSTSEEATSKRKSADSGAHGNGEEHDPKQSTTASGHESEFEDVKPPWLNMTLEMKKFLEIQDEELQLYLKHTNNRIARLDSEVEEKSAEAKRLAREYTGNMLLLTDEQKRAIYLRIEQLLDEVAKKDDEKVRLANMMYDTTCAHIDQMDKHVHDFEELKEKRRRAELQAAEAASSSAKDGNPSTSQETTRKENESAGSGAHENEEQHAPVQSTSASGHASAPDKTEPLYCVCRDVSYGDMVACDSKACKIEWFHFDCVGMITPPDGEWFCPDCTEQMMKKRKKK